MLWKDIPSTNGKYQANDYGHIRNSKTERILVPQKGVNNYLVVTIYPGKHSRPIHQLVAEAFHGIRPDGLIVNHKDGDKQNNCSDNLEYITSSENNIHALRNGLRKVADMEKVIKRGVEHYRSTLNEDQVLQIRQLRHEGLSAGKIASKLGLPIGPVGGVAYGKTYKNVKEG